MISISHSIYIKRKISSLPYKLRLYDFQFGVAPRKSLSRLNI